jgi:hypothetical protein
VEISIDVSNWSDATQQEWLKMDWSNPNITTDPVYEAKHVGRSNIEAGSSSRSSCDC